MTGLSQFLLDRIAEDEAPSWELVPRPRWMGGPVGFVGHHCFICEETSHGGTPEAMTEAAQDHDEKIHRRSRVLAECAAKRRIVEDHAPTDVSAPRYEGIIGSERQVGESEPACRQCTRSTQRWRVTGLEPTWEGSGIPRVVAPCDTLRALASVYADHADYDESWAL